MSVSNESRSQGSEDASPLIDRIHWTVVFVILPIVSILGLTGNSLSLVVLYRQGFKKSSNIILFALATSDILFLIGTNGPPRVIYQWGRGGFWYAEPEARAMFYLYQLCDFLNWTAGPLSWWLPILITAERCVAVFFPLKFRQIVTRGRTFTCIIIMAVSACLPQIYARLWFQFRYQWDPVYNASVGLAARTEFYWETVESTIALGMFYSLGGYYVIFIGSGCVAIVVRISLAAAQRRRMTGKDGGTSTDTEKYRGPSRTTKTLLTLCLFNTVTCMIASLPNYYPDIIAWPLFTPDINYKSVKVFMYQILMLDLSLNASINFVIYIVMNKNFRDTFLQIFGRGSNIKG